MFWNTSNLKFLKSKWGEQSVKDIPIFTCICVSICVFICVTAPGQTKNDIPEIWYAYSPRLNLKNAFFRKRYVRGISLEKLTCHVDFPHISSIALKNHYSFNSTRHPTIDWLWTINGFKQCLKLSFHLFSKLLNYKLSMAKLLQELHMLWLTDFSLKISSKEKLVVRGLPRNAALKNPT